MYGQAGKRESVIREALKLSMTAALVALSLTQACLAQETSSEQLWFEYLLNYPFGSVYNLENAFTYSTDLHQPKWRAMEYCPTLERSFTRHVDAQVAFTTSYTQQNDTSNTLELRPMIGARIHFTPNKRILTRLLMRFERRFFQDRESLDWDKSSRSRLRAEAIIPINRRSYAEDRQWYGVVDAEWFFVMDQDVNERFANRFRLRAGAGYRLNKKLRFEVLYVLQEAKNKIGEDFYTSDHIFRFRVKHYISTRQEREHAGGDGN